MGEKVVSREMEGGRQEAQGAQEDETCVVYANNFLMAERLICTNLQDPS